MRLPKARRRDAEKLGFGAELIDRRASDVTHSAAQASDHLEQHVAYGAAIRHATFNSLRNQLPRRQLSFLEIAIGASILHRGEAAHPAYHLEATSLEQEALARALLGARQHGSHHHACRTGGERLHGIAR